MPASVTPTPAAEQSLPAVGLPREKTAGAIVIGGAHGSLGTVRALGRRGIPVWVLTNDHRIAALSRYARKTPRWPAAEPSRQVEYLLELAHRYDLAGWTLFPGGDVEAELISRHHQELAASYRLITAPWSVLRWACDKRLTYQLAADIGTAFPWTHVPASRKEVETLDCPFPLILKPAVKEPRSALTRDKAWRADNRAALVSLYDRARALMPADQILLQEMIPGAGEAQFSYAALWTADGPAASLMARRTRQYPVEFGYTSTYVETVEQPELENVARRLLEAIGYTGLVEVEFKYDRRDGRFKLLDINGRTWTWHMLGSRAGIDFTWLAWLAAQGQTVPKATAAPGVHWIHMPRDLVAGCQEILRGRLSAREYLRSLRGPREYAVVAKDDPLPALMEMPLMLERYWKRIRG